MSNITGGSQEKEISLQTLILQLKAVWQFLKTKWLLIVIFGFGGASIGLTYTFIQEPIYKANLSFVLIEKGTSGGLASLASNFGLSSMLGLSNNSAFSGDNLLEIIKSRYAIEKTLLTVVNFEGEKKTLIDAYIQFNEMHKKWQKSKNEELRYLSYPASQNRESFSRTQDSVLYAVYTTFIKTEALTVVRKDKKIGIVNIDFSSKNEQFSKLLVDNLMSQTTKFYSETRTAQSRVNIEMMEHTADSIKKLYEDALFNSATISQVNINRAMQTAVVPRIKQENNAQLYGTVYAEVLKNLESLKLDLARETPIVQIIDTPRYPLKNNKLSKLQGLVLGGFIGGVIVVLYLLLFFYFKSSTESLSGK